MTLNSFKKAFRARYLPFLLIALVAQVRPCNHLQSRRISSASKGCAIDGEFFWGV